MADIPTVIGAAATAIAGSEGLKWGFRWLTSREDRLSKTEGSHSEKLALERRLVRLEEELRVIKDNTALIAKAIDTIKQITILLEEVFKPRLEDHEERLRDVERGR